MFYYIYLYLLRLNNPVKKSSKWPGNFRFDAMKLRCEPFPQLETGGDRMETRVHRLEPGGHRLETKEVAGWKQKRQNPQHLKGKF